VDLDAVYRSSDCGLLAANWPQAKIFTGDVGSTYLAFMILRWRCSAFRQAG
jgi:hypothetical protein